MTVVRLETIGFADSDLEERAEMTSRLGEELRAAGADVSRTDGARLSGSKGLALEWAELIVTVSGNLPALIGAVRGWLGRNRGASVTLEVDGDRLELIDAADDERRKLVDAWLARHGN